MATIEVRGIDNVLIAVGDLTEAKRFYAEKLGLPIKFEFAEARLVAFRLGDGEPALLARQSEIPRSGPRETPRVWLVVRDARATSESLATAGVATLGAPREIFTGWVVEIADPWGNVLGLTDYTKRPDLA